MWRGGLSGRFLCLGFVAEGSGERWTKRSAVQNAASPRWRPLALVRYQGIDSIHVLCTYIHSYAHAIYTYRGGGGECGYCRKQNRSTRHGVLRTSAREVAAYSSQSRTDGPAQLRTRGPGPNRRMQKRVAGCQTRAPRVSPDDARLAPPPMHRCPSPFPDADARTITKSV